MPKIIVSNLFNKAISFSKRNENEENVLVLLHKNNIDWMFSCGGKGKCTTCKFEIRTGNKNFSPFSEGGVRFKKLNLLRKNERLACQAIPLGDVQIKVLAENKLPHLIYSI